MSLLNHKPLREELTTDQQIRRRTLKAMLGFGVASLVPVGVWQWVRSQPNAAGIPAPLRSLLNTNEKIANVYFSPTHLAPTYPANRAANPPRTNGMDGLRSPVERAGYHLTIEQPGRKPMTISIDELKKLPKHELVFDFKCVEGWSQIQHWGGVKFADFVAHYGFGTRSGQPPSPDDPDDFYKFVGMETPDRGYYVGLDMPSALHPQTLLAFEMNGQPITPNHGAPVRLIIPVKYGVK
ncbi:MAG: molybdopterin-dependent oxidoreductase, partial [Bacteroidetes bacterium]|nr:molybdopterin-dependent oxidoreductase [Fibrella sp.]